MKHNGRHEARLVAGGYLTDALVTSIYSGVVSLRRVRLVLFLSELNDLESWRTNIGNTYLEAKTKEKVYVITEKEFSNLKGHDLRIRKALCRLHSSELYWHERLVVCLRSMGSFPCKIELDIWMKDCGGYYEHIVVYVDDVLIVSKDPKSVIKCLLEDYKFKLKGTGSIKHHLGCDFSEIAIMYFVLQLEIALKR